MSQLEDDLRATLRRRAVDVGAMGGMPNDVRRRAQVRRAGTAGLAGVLTVALVVLGIGVVRAMLPEPSPQPAPSPRLPLVEHVPVTPRSNGDLTYFSGGAIIRRATDGTTSTWVTRRALDDACGSTSCTLTDLQWSPDGSALAVVMGVVRRTSPSQFAVYVVAEGEFTARRVFDCPQPMCPSMEGPSVSWSPDGASLAVTGMGEGLVVAAVDEPSAEPRAVCEDCQATSVAWSPDGRWIAYAGNGGIRRISPDGGTSEVISSTTPALSLAWSPDGTRLLVDSDDAVRVLDLSRRPYSEDIVIRTQLGEGPSVPAWAPDGRRVSWFSTPRDQNGRYIATVWTAGGDGSRPQRLLQSECCVSDGSAPLWSPDGRFIALGLSLDPRQPPDLLVLDVRDGSEVARTPGAGWAPMSWQPVP